MVELETGFIIGGQSNRIAQRIRILNGTDGNSPAIGGCDAKRYMIALIFAAIAGRRTAGYKKESYKEWD